MKNKSTRYIVESAVIGAFYAVLTCVFAPISYGVVQFRISEALTVLPLLTPAAVPGLAVGCVISNFIGVMTGANLAGAWDVLIGSAATVLAALCTYALRNIRIKELPLLSLLAPIVFNGAIVGGELFFVLPAEFSLLLGVASVAAGEAVVVFVLGVPLYFMLKKSRIFEKLHA
ncbi:MAG: QueT transporter family protein [Acutalibacteraceae bacterium]